MTQREATPAAALALVALARAELPTEGAWLASFGELAPGRRGPAVVERAEGSLVGEAGRERFVVSMLPAPLDPADARRAAAASWFWPAASAALEGHSAHLAVAVTRGSDSQTRATLLARLVGALVLASAGNARAILWTSAGILHEPGTFVDVVRRVEPEQLPIELWIGFGLADDGQRAVVESHGLAAFALPELEVHARGGDGQEAYAFAFNVAHYLLQSGASVGEGETIGMSPRQRIPARYAPSRSDASRTILRLELPAAAP
jgi:hypothetical protein